jgi:hypothetical protein
MKQSEPIQVVVTNTIRTVVVVSGKWIFIETVRVSPSGEKT